MQMLDALENLEDFKDAQTYVPTGFKQIMFTFKDKGGVMSIEKSELDVMETKNVKVEKISTFDLDMNLKKYVISAPIPPHSRLDFLHLKQI